MTSKIDTLIIEGTPSSISTFIRLLKERKQLCQNQNSFNQFFEICRVQFYNDISPFPDDFLSFHQKTKSVENK